MVESGIRLRKALRPVRGVDVQPDADGPVGCSEDDGISGVVWVLLFHQLREPEHVAVPGDASLDVGDGDRNVVDC